MEFYGDTDSINVHKESGTDVNYFIFSEYEIHLNKIGAGSVQEWHYHSNIEETLLITKGELSCYWVEDNTKIHKLVKKNEIIRVNNSIHTFANESNNDVEFVVFRFVPDHVDKRELIKNDKIVVDIE